MTREIGGDIERDTYMHVGCVNKQDEEAKEATDHIKWEFTTSFNCHIKPVDSRTYPSDR